MRFLFLSHLFYGMYVKITDNIYRELTTEFERVIDIKLNDKE